MTKSHDSAQADVDFACHLAHGAGQILLQLRQDSALHASGESPDGDAAKQLGKAGDRASHEWLLHQLQQAHPADAVLSEEGSDSAVRLQAQRVWIIDPLDGTREYGQGRDDWAVHVALWQRSHVWPAGSAVNPEQTGSLVAAAIALPARDQVSSTTSPGAAAGQRAPTATVPWRLAVSRTRPPELIGQVEQVLAQQNPAVRLERLPMGSAGVKIAAVILGQADAYLHAGGQYEWDSAAPVAVAQAAGLHASRIDGQPLCYNQPNPWLPDLLVCQPQLARPLLKAIATASSCPVATPNVT